MKYVISTLLLLCSYAQAESLDIQSSFRKQEFSSITNNTQVLTDINADELRTMLTNAIAIAANAAYTNANARAQAASNALAQAVTAANSARASGDDGLQAVIGAVSNLFHAVAQAETVTRSNAVEQAMAGVTGNSNRIVAAAAAIAANSNLTATAWQNSDNSTNFQWSSDGVSITITNYIGSNLSVIIPDLINGLPVSSIGTEAFTSGAPLYIGDAITNIAGGINLKTISASSFFKCSSLQSVSFPEVESVGNTAFHLCTNLTSLLLPKATVIGNSFQHCRKLSSLKIPLVGLIPNSAFYGCTNLTDITMTAATNIVAGAFIDCFALQTIRLDSIASIAGSAFNGCTSLRSVYFIGNCPIIGSNIYGGIPANQVTNFVLNALAEGWGETLGGMPVMRTPLAGTVITIGAVQASGNVEAASYTLNGSPFAGGGSSAPLSWTPITTVPVSTIATARVTTAKNIFYFESSEAVSFTNDLSALSVNCGTNVAWTIVFNATGTNACNSTNWYGIVDFVNGPPEITCTGRQEYACDTSCGTRVRVRQVYPTVHPWKAALHAGARNLWATTLSVGPVVMLNQADTNAVCYIVRDDFAKPVLFKFYTNFTGLDAAHATNRVYARMGIGNNATAAIYPSNCPTVAISTNATSCVNYMYIPYLVWPGATTAHGFNLQYNRINALGTAQRVDLGEQQWVKVANENEQAVGTNKLGWAAAYQ